MEEQNSNYIPPVVFRDLPRDQRKALQKEYAATPEGKKMNKTILIVTFIVVGLILALVIISVATNHNTYSGYSTPVPMIWLWPAIIYNSNFEKWLLAEKNIVIRRVKVKKVKP